MLVLAIALVLQWHGDRELGMADLLLAELHLGATYDAVVRGRLWRHMPVEVVAVPLAITAATYALMFGGGSVLVTTAVLYLAAWHRGRQNLGIARYYHSHYRAPNLVVAVAGNVDHHRVVELVGRAFDAHLSGSSERPAPPRLGGEATPTLGGGARLIDSRG